MKVTNGQCAHVVLYGTFMENKYFLQEYKEKFDIIGFNSSIIAFRPGGMAAFIAQLKNKSYFIDPQTHAFQHDPKKVKSKKKDKYVLKKSIENLANQYGSVYAKNVGKSKIKPNQLTNEDYKIICKNVLDFELNIVEDSSKNTDVKDFIDYSESSLKPDILIAPYFYIEPDEIDDELKSNIIFINESKEYLSQNSSARDIPLFAEVVIEHDVLVRTENLQKVLKAYNDCSVDGIILWIDNFNETDENLSNLSTYIQFVKELGSNRPIINLHGSYLSTILASTDYSLLAGVGHGIEYGEYRSVVPVGGGVPLAKFYFPKFHKRVDYHPDTENILTEMGWDSNIPAYKSDVCSCRQCNSIIIKDVQKDFSEYGETKISPKNGRPYPTANALDKSRKHYLNNKINEYNFCSTKNRVQIIDELKKYTKIANSILNNPFNHLEKWVKVLSEVV